MKQPSKPVKKSDLKGGSKSVKNGVRVPDATYENPGKTPNLRGVEANTSRQFGGSMPVVQGQTEPKKDL